MSADRPTRPVHTEHVLFECWIDDGNAASVRLFRAPTVLDGSGSHKRCPHEIKWDEIRDGDVVIALRIEEISGVPCFITIFQFWHVLEKRGDEVRVMVNNIAGSSADGEYVYDRLAGLVGMPPSDRG